ncbi:hypothetical protein ISF_06967 [Cordyceps fumosorosea ARSEF 2679]|uniref:Uncharacterized protein n=1 Tax=Cordyceps fumosorosea (strain ARSEF 2679) TaxID=1081104 RepID=A0A167QKP3_CORFA|nr:hypothetical protein ISF_06967 [Cordyceps fumosorosea ARSEF 2679]OAA57726.1 hypothetical protein ISF_06967 [Cordyceps fumosorosea ARSEF 2679]
MKELFKERPLPILPPTTCFRRVGSSRRQRAALCIRKLESDSVTHVPVLLRLWIQQLRLYEGSTVPGQFNNNAVAPIAFTPPGGIATSIDVPAPRRRVTVSFSTRSSRNASGCAAFYPNLTVKVSGGVADHSFEISENTIAWTQKSFTFKPKTDGIFVIAVTTSPQASIGCAPTIYNVQAYQDRE